MPQPSENPNPYEPPGIDSPAESAISLSRPAGFWIRVLAIVIDFLVLSPVGVFGFLSVFYFKSLPLRLALIIPGLLYKPLMEAFYGASLGKLALGMRVVDHQGARISVSAAYVRFLPQLCLILIEVFSMFWLFSLPEFAETNDFLELARLLEHNPVSLAQSMLSWAFLGDCVSVAFNDRKRAVHDLFAGSYVVYK